jgi:acetyl esterase/lipase
LQARVLLDAARAVYGFSDNPPVDNMLAQPAQAVFFMGYSSGGHAAFAARDLAGSYAPELPVKGIMGHGPTTNIETLLREDPVFSPYIIYAYRDFYGSEIIDVADVFLSSWVPTFDSDVLGKCVDDIFSYYSRSARRMYSPEFRDVLYGDKLDQAFPLFAEKLSTNDAGVSGGSRIPVLILQGTADTVVTPDSQRAFKDQLCEQGNNVTYLEYSAVPHVAIRWTSFSDTLSWMQRIVEGDIPETDCEVANPQR